MENISDLSQIFLMGAVLIVTSASLIMASLAHTRANAALKLAKSYEDTLETLAGTINQMKLDLRNAGSQYYPPPRQEKKTRR